MAFTTIMQPPKNIIQKNTYQKLFEYMYENHNIYLSESDMNEIVNILKFDIDNKKYEK